MNRRSPWIVLFAAGFILILAPAAHAYLDPGSGSFIFQILIGGLLGVAVAVKAFWGRIWGFLTRRKQGKTEERVGKKGG